MTGDFTNIKAPIRLAARTALIAKLKAAMSVALACFNIGVSGCGKISFMVRDIGWASMFPG
jgi:hypothetical protein